MPSPKPARPRAAALQAGKQRFVRDQVWDAATDLFARHGFDQTTVDDIALAAGISRRSFFRYFSSKNDLMAYGMVNYGAELVAAIDACPPAFSPYQVLEHTVVTVAQRSAVQPRTLRILDIVTRYPAARAAEISRLHEVQDQVAAAYARRTPRKSPMAPSLLAGLTLHALAVTFHAWHAAPGRDISAAARQALATLRQLVSA